MVDLESAIIASAGVAHSRFVIWGGRSIAAYLNKPAKWFWRQRERGKRPPPHHKHEGGAIYAYADELDAWLEKRARRVVNA